MTTRIGRFTFDDRPEVYQHATGEVRVQGAVFADTTEQADFIRTQLVGMAAPGAEKAVPVVIEDGFSGFVEPSSVSCEAVGGSMGKAWFRYDLTGRKVPGPTAPLIESHVTGTLRVNGNSVAAGDDWPFHAVPLGGAHDWYKGEAYVEQETRDAENGQISVRYARDVAPTPSTRYASGVARWSVPNDSYYVGAAGVQVESAGRWLPVTGRDALDASWRLTNGLVRVSIPEGDDHLTFWWYDGDNWSSAILFDLLIGINENVVTGDDVSDPVVWETARIVRNDPALTSVSLIGQAAYSGATPYDDRIAILTLSVRRGSPWVTIHYDEPNTSGTTSRWPILAANTASAVTASAARAYQTTASSGWQWMFAAAEDHATNTTSGILYSASGDDRIKTFGVAATHSSITGQREIATLHQEWYAAQAERTHIGVRL